MKHFLVLLSAFALFASLLGAAAVTHQQRVQTFGAVSGLPDPNLDPRPNPMAVNVALEQYTHLDPVLDSLTAFHWLRQTFPWDEIEPMRGEYHWEKWDAIVAQVMTRQKELIAVLNFSPEWARPVSPADFAAFASAFAARYADSINVYQIWDEPNLLSGWGHQPPSAAGYAALLQAAYTAIHAADPQATVLAAALAPTTETGPDNLSDLIYLQQLYDLGANQYFDAAAGKPYGFYTGPDDRRADPAHLNFSRFTLLRQVMERNGDGEKLLWAGNFGWNTRPSDSLWGSATPDQQVQYTLAAYQRAINEWPWAGPLALENYQPAAPANDPRWGFALSDSSDHPTKLLEAFAERSSLSPYAIPGNHSAVHSAAHYSGDWQFSDLGADIPKNFSAAQVEISFQGTDFALQVRRGDYRGYLYVQIDGQPANLLPQDARGAYLVLTSPQLNPEVVTIPVAAGLSPDRTHVVIIQPERGWGQWAFVGFSVGRRLSNSGYRLALGLLAVVALLSALGVWHFGREISWGTAGASVQAAWERLGATGQLLLTALIGGLLYLTSWLTFGDEVISISRRFGDALPIALTALTAGLFYFSPSFILALVFLVLLFVLFYLRLDLAFAFAALFIPFYLFPRMLWERGAPLVEVVTLLAALAWLLRNARPLLVRLKTQGRRRPTLYAFRTSDLTFLDWGMLALLLVAALSLFVAEVKRVAIHEFRVVIFEPALFYFLVRSTPLDRRAVWRMMDFFLLGAVLVAGLGLYQYLTQTNLIMAEEGVARIRSVYGSPNNLALYLGRALPIAVALTLLGEDQRFSFSLRRIFYTFATLSMGLTIVLTFSKGALFLGVPASLALILILWLGRRGLMVMGAAIVGGLVGLPLLSQLPRFANLLNLTSGTSFFRVKLWSSAFRMFLDHPLLGVGLDNFLYQYRSRYILPEAWQEPNLSHPHNMVLDFLARLGLFGLVCGLWLQVAFWRSALNTYRRLRSTGVDRDLLALCIGLMASMANMLAHGLVDHSFFLVDLAFVFCLTLAVMQQVQRLAEAPVKH